MIAAMWTRWRSACLAPVKAILQIEAAIGSLLLLALMLWGLLAARGDQTGADAAKILAAAAALGLGMLQIVLLHLLALQPEGVKMEAETRV
jgi:hypothetical protein